ncbi:MAG TPA: hypothetical protein VGU20_02725 [Stellaceae bacterium]|nr:hypothetical protein [Stellaceae bacterium]
MERVVVRENIEWHWRLLATETDAAKRKLLYEHIARAEEQLAAAGPREGASTSAPDANNSALVGDRQ